jgi:hypothetical protein
MAAHSRQQRRAGRALAWGAALFAGLQAGLSLAMHTALPRWRDPRLADRLDALARRQDAAGPGAPSVLVLGSSRVVHGVHAQAMERELAGLLGRPAAVCNAAYLGGGPFRSLRTWRQVRGRVRVDLVVLEVMPPWLNRLNPLVETTEGIFPPGELSRDDVALIARHTDARPWLAAQWARSLAVPVHDCRYQLLSLAAPLLLPWEYRREKLSGKDFARECDPAQRPTALANAAGTYRPYLGVYAVGGPGWQALVENAETLHRDGVPFLLLLMPEGPFFQSLYAPGTWAELRSALDGLARATGAEVLDARGWFPAEEDHSDSHHLVPSAGRAFSRRLARECLYERLRGAGGPAPLIAGLGRSD